MRSNPGGNRGAFSEGDPARSDQQGRVGQRGAVGPVQRNQVRLCSDLSSQGRCGGRERERLRRRWQRCSADECGECGERDSCGARLRPRSRRWAAASIHPLTWHWTGRERSRARLSQFTLTFLASHYASNLRSTHLLSTIAARESFIHYTQIREKGRFCNEQD